MYKMVKDVQKPYIKNNLEIISLKMCFKLMRLSVIHHLPQHLLRANSCHAKVCSHQKRTVPVIIFMAQAINQRYNECAKFIQYRPYYEQLRLICGCLTMGNSECTLMVTRTRQRQLEHITSTARGGVIWHLNIPELFESYQTDQRYFHWVHQL